MRCSCCHIRPATRAVEKYLHPQTKEVMEVRSEFCSKECATIHHASMRLPLLLVHIDVRVSA